MPDIEKKPDEKPPVDESITKVLEDLRVAADKINKPDEKPEVPSVPDYTAQREADRKALGFTEEQMQAHERTVARTQAPVIEQTAWSVLEKRPDLEKYRKEIQAEAERYPQERRNPQLMEMIYHMIRGKHMDDKPVTETKPVVPRTNRVESSRVSAGPGYSGTEGGTSTEKEPADRNEQLSEAEANTARKLGVDEKRFALSRSTGRDITPLKRQDDRQATTGADLELRRLQGARR